MRIGNSRAIGNFKAGFCQTIYETTLTSSQTSITVSSLDGDTDGVYLFELFEKSTEADHTVYLHLNNDTTSGNYGSQYEYDSGTTFSAGRYTNTGILCAKAGTSGPTAFCRGIIFAKSGTVRTIEVDQCDYIHETYGVIDHYHMFWSWNNTSSNLTSLVFTAGVSNGFSAGTYIRVSRLVAKE